MTDGDVFMSISDFFKRPFLWTGILWLFFFLSFACFKIDGVTAVNYLSAAAFLGTVFYLYARNKEKIRKIPEKKRKAVFYMLGGVVMGIIMIYTFDHVKSNPAIHSRNDMIPFFFLTGGLFLYAVIVSLKKKWCEKRILLVILLLSSIVHLFFIMSAKFNVAQWDTGSFFSTGNGHMGYIEYLYHNHFIPAQFDPREKWQYYHPPLYHLTEAVLLKLQTLCGVDMMTAVNNTQYPTMLYGMITTTCSYFIFKEMKLKKLPVICATSVIAFSPAFIYVSGFVNNDMLSVMFVFLCILYTLRWHKNPTLRNILKIALCFGLGMLSKMSVSLIAPSVAVVFISVLFKSLKSKEYRTFGKYIGQMLAFLAVAAPLSLYWSLRNLIRFGVPLGYVPESNISIQYIPQDIITRLFDFRPYQLINPYFNLIEYGDNFNEYNPLMALLKTSASEEGLIRFTFGEPAGYALLFSTLMTAACALVLMIYVMCKKNTLAPVWKVFLGVTYVIYLFSYEWFCIGYPYTCTEHIRYAMPLILVGALSIGLGLKYLSPKKSALSRIFVCITAVSVGIFSLISVFLFVYKGVVTSVQMML